jgi:hypothetical protein
MEFRGRVGDWIADIRQARDRGDTVLFVAESSGRAERTIRQEYDLLPIPVDRAEDVHAASVRHGRVAVARLAPARCVTG